MDTLEHEEWRPVAQYEGRYEVSSLGRVRSLARCFVINGAERCVPNSIMRLQHQGYGYMQVHLKKHGRREKFLIHRLVAMTFIPNLNNLPEVNHRHGVKHDNRVSELEWTTGTKNVSDYYKNVDIMETANEVF